MGSKMTIEEAHITATLQFGDKYDGRIFVQVSTSMGDDPTPQCEILIAGEYDGDDCLGYGPDWESAFEAAVKGDLERDESKKRYEALQKRGEEIRKNQAKQAKLEKRKNRAKR